MSLQPDDDDIEALVLETSPRKWAWICLGCIGFVLLGMVVVVAGYVVAGLLVAAFFGACLVVAARQMSRPGRLVVIADSFEVLHIGQATTRDFLSCSRFEVWRGGKALVVFDHPIDDAKQFSAENRRLTGRSGSLPDTYGVRVTDLADLLNTARAEARVRAGTTDG
jgi:hypothetical protein